MKPTKKNIIKVAAISRAEPKDDRQTAPNEVEPHRRAQETSRYRLKSVATADNTIRIVKGRMPALAHDSGMDNTPPPTIVAVILKTAAMTLAFRVDDDADGTRKATSAMEVACRRSGMNVGYRRRMGESGTSCGLTADVVSSHMLVLLAAETDVFDASRGSLLYPIALPIVYSCSTSRENLIEENNEEAKANTASPIASKSEGAV